MPATIIGNTDWNQRKLILSRMDAQEQVNGMVNVQVEYVGPSSSHDTIARSFYQDAPPPIWPSVISRDELVTNRLFMESRTVTKANGITTVNASYVGGLQRPGFRGYFLRETIEPGRLGVAFYYRDSVKIADAVAVWFDPSGAARSVDAGTWFIFDQRIKQIDFVRIGDVSSASFPVFYRHDLVSVPKASNYRRNDATTSYIEAADLWTNSRVSSEAYISGQLSYEKTTPVKFTESEQYVTSTVKLVTRTYRLFP